MKKVIVILPAILLCFTLLTHAQTSEEDAVKKVAYDETTAWIKRDTAAWQHFILKSNTTTKMAVANGYYEYARGWDNFVPLLTQWMKERKTPSLYTKLEHYNPIVTVNDDIAYLEYDQMISAPQNDSLPPSISREYRTMKKENGEWKITSFITVDTPSFRSSEPWAIENNLNSIGYELLQNKKTNDAIEVFKLNVKLFPDAWNTYDSLGEAYAEAGNKAEAIKNYEYSVRLNPQNDNGKKVLEKLRSK